MEPIKQRLEYVFDVGHRMLQNLSVRWREHANRRTIIILLLVGAFATYLYLFTFAPPDTFPLDQLVSVPSGESLNDVAATLQQDGVVRSALAFRIMVTGQPAALVEGSQPIDFTLRDTTSGEVTIYHSVFMGPARRR